MSEHHDHRDDCPFKFATLDVCDCVEKNMLDRIDALTAKLTNLVEKSNAMLDAFCVLETQRQVEAYDSMCTTLAEIEGEKG